MQYKHIHNMKNDRNKEKQRFQSSEKEEKESKCDSHNVTHKCMNKSKQTKNLENNA